MSKEKENRTAELGQETLDQVSGGIQAGQIMATEWWDEFGNHYVKDSSGKVRVYRPDGTEINPPQKTQKRTWL